MTKPDTLLWLDLETTGDDDTKDCIIEVGVIATTTDLDELGSASWVVRPTPEGLGRLMTTAPVREMHQANGLLDAILDAARESGSDLPTPHDVARSLLDWAGSCGAKTGRTVICGSGVGHFDRRFLARWMPQVHRFCRHWVIDVGVIRRAHAMWVGGEPVSTANDAKTHRALDDARCHLAEARAFAELWQLLDV